MTFCREEPNRPLVGRWNGTEWTRLSPHEEQLAAKQAEIEALTAQVTEAKKRAHAAITQCDAAINSAMQGNPGEYVAAITRDNRDLMVENERLKAQVEKGAKA
jgi:hypothetical protein